MGPTFYVYAVFFAVRLAISLTYGVVLLILRRAIAYNFIPPVIPPPTAPRWQIGCGREKLAKYIRVSMVVCAYHPSSSW